jgi:phenylpropionate dioxygenase-like ring-hydroxylating dioxygenase large terminal subunit
MDAMASNGWDKRWDLGPDSIPRERYTSRAFFELELERFWPRVWQVACRAEQLPEVGSYVEYTIGDQSILVVRTESRAIKAYFNSCRHRGTRLASGCGRLAGRTIRCPFHGWSWRLDGTNAHVFSREQFSRETLDEANLRLAECRVGTWGGFVFINMDDDAVPLEQALAPATRWLDPVAIERMEALWHKQVVLPINWKGALDAFTESYHVLATHPEYGEFGTDPLAFRYYQDPGGHSHYSVPLDNVTQKGGIDEREQFFRYVSWNIDQIGAMYTEKDRHIAAQLRHHPIPEGSSLAQEYARELYTWAARTRAPLPTPSPEDFNHVGFNFVFPHLAFLPTLGNALCYRSRPNGMDHDSTLWDIWSLTIFPEDAPRPPYRVQQADWSDPEQVGRVLHQDFSNMLEVSAGMRNRGFERLRLNTVQEMGLLHMQREIDRYLRS